MTQNWLKNEHEDSVIEWFPLKNGNIMVKIKDKECVNDEGKSEKVNSQTFHLGSFILSQSKRLKNDVILALTGFKLLKDIMETPIVCIYTTTTIKY